MSAIENTKDGPLGDGATVTKVRPDAVFKVYAADRPAIGRAKATEIVLDVSITLAHPVRKVWPVFKNFNLWMNRFGYFWESVPGDNEDRYVQLSDQPWPNGAKTRSGVSATKYIVRRVIPQSLIYFDSLPAPIGVGKDGVWTGHNVVSLYEEGAQTKIGFLMEHTWYSETMGIAELRAEASAMSKGEVFWRDFFIPDLVSAVESGRGS